MTAAERIFSQAKAGTAYNPGVPDLLASLVVSQSRHETGDYTSRFFRENNNAFGYAYYAGSAYQTGAGGIADNGSPIADYASIEDSTKEIIDWLYRRLRQGKLILNGIALTDLRQITTTEDYAQVLKAAGYYQDALSNYLAGLKRFYVPIAVTSGVGLLIALAVLIYGKYDRWF